MTAPVTWANYTCPKCHQTTTQRANATVWHNCPHDHRERRLQPTTPPNDKDDTN